MVKRGFMMRPHSTRRVQKIAPPMVLVPEPQSSQSLQLSEPIPATAGSGIKRLVTAKRRRKDPDFSIY
jgi:hypothetical protein